MSKINIHTPTDNVVSVVFSFKNHVTRCTTPSSQFDEYDHLLPTARKDAKTYTYRVPDGLVGKLRVGDMVVVRCATGYQVAEVDSTTVWIAPSKVAELACVVGVVNSDEYFEYIEKQKHLAVLREQLEVEKKRIESMITYELLAERNPEFKAMLDNFKVLGGVIE